MTATELRAQRAKLIEQGRAIHAKAKAETRELTAEEREQDDKLWTEGDKLKAQYEQLEADQRRASRLDEAHEQLSQSAGRETRSGQPGRLPEGKGNEPLAIRIEQRRAWSRTPIVHEFSYAPGTAAYRRNQPDMRAAFRDYLRTGHISAQLQTDSAVDGGYLTMPEQLVAELIKDLDDVVWLRRLCRTFATSAQSLGARKRTARMSTFAWGQELTTPTADSSLKFGKRSLTPHYMTGEISVSNDLLRAAELNPEMIVREEMARDSGEVEEDAFLEGNGSGQPLGVFTASADGVSTGRDVATGSTTSITADGLRNAKYSLKQSYRADPSIGWLFHRDAIKIISKLKDGAGDYLWQQGITQGDPDRLLNYPVYESERAPNTFTSNLYVGMLACWRFYWIVDGLDFGIQTHDLDIRSNLKGFIARRKVDGMPMVEEAFARLKCATS